MNGTKVIMPQNDVVVDALQELVEALDRRVPHVERVGETRIADDATALREEAVQRIDELTTARSHADTHEAERSAAVMSDDGGPLKMGE